MKLTVLDVLANEPTIVRVVPGKTISQCITLNIWILVQWGVPHQPHCGTRATPTGMGGRTSSSLSSRVDRLAAGAGRCRLRRRRMAAKGPGRSAARSAFRVASFCCWRCSKQKRTKNLSQKFGVGLKLKDVERIMEQSVLCQNWQL